jgi:hypothetical protein
MSLGRRLDDERGVTAAIVAVTLFVLLGMLALTVDLGFMTVKRRAMVRSADAAALGYAESCTKLGIGTPDAQADALAVANVGNATRVGPAVWPIQGTCAPGAAVNGGSVTVTYEGESGVFFGRIFGVGDERVHATATAVWGPAVATSGVMPFMLNANQLSSCRIFPNPAPGTECWFYTNNGTNYIGNAQWGALNVQPDPNQPSTWGWNVPRNYSCPAPLYGTDQVRYAIAHGSPYLPTGNPDTYVCIATGVRTPAWEDFKAFENLADTDPNKIKVFPVNDPNRQVDASGNICTSTMVASGLCRVNKYDIVGFTALQVKNVYAGTNNGKGKGKGGSWPAQCSALGPNDPNAWCFRAVWIDYHQSDGLPCTTCPNYGVETVALQQ